LGAYGELTHAQGDTPNDINNWSISVLGTVYLAEWRYDEEKQCHSHVCSG